ncbi:hypothetical protein BE20_03160 [Sorangium cellulosum]|nr:hypothetical protein BE20_03160 [Sorangium cellulosum]
MISPRMTKPYQTRRSIEKGSGGTLLVERLSWAGSPVTALPTTANALSTRPPGSGASSVGTPSGAAR